MTLTREEAIKVYRAFGFMKTEPTLRHNYPAWIAERIMDECAEDFIDALMCLGVLKCAPPAPAPESPQVTTTPSPPTGEAP